VGALEKARALGARLEGGINWTWGYFPSQEIAEQFTAWLDRQGYEHRGAYDGEVRFR